MPTALVIKANNILFVERKYRGGPSTPHLDQPDKLPPRVLPQGPAPGRQSQVRAQDHRRSEETVPGRTTAIESDKGYEDKRPCVQGMR